MLDAIDLGILWIPSVGYRSKRRPFLFGGIEAMSDELTTRNGRTYRGKRLASGKIQDEACVTYYQKGLPSREDGPAVIFHDGTKLWYVNGEFQHGERVLKNQAKSFVCDGVKQKVTHVKERWNGVQVFHEFYRGQKLLMRVERKKGKKCSTSKS